MYRNFSKANMDTQTSSHMLLKNNSTEALNQILFPAREREIFEHFVFYYILLYCDQGTKTVACKQKNKTISDNNSCLLIFPDNYFHTDKFLSKD